MLITVLNKFCINVFSRFSAHVTSLVANIVHFPQIKTLNQLANAKRFIDLVYFSGKKYKIQYHRVLGLQLLDEKSVLYYVC